MSVYVDPELNMAGPSAPRCFRNGHCHMYADTLEELHSFATKKLRLKREWFQDHRTLKHYDLTVGKRTLAIAKGAIEHSRAEAVAKWKELRDKELKLG